MRTDGNGGLGSLWLPPFPPNLSIPYQTLTYRSHIYSLIHHLTTLLYISYTF